MKIKIIAHWLVAHLVIVMVLWMSAFSVQAQLIDEPVTQLSDVEILRLRRILDEPIDPSALNSAKSSLFREKDFVAFKLGDAISRESNARAWILVDPVDGKWSLMSVLADAGQRTQTYQLAQELMNEVKWPPSAVRLRAQTARNYIDDSQLKKAGLLIEEAEKLVRYEFRQISRQGDSSFQIARAELELFSAKSVYLMRMGRWAEGIQVAKLAVLKSKEMLDFSSLVKVGPWRTYGQANALVALVMLSTHQLAAGLYADAEWTLRDTFKLSKAQGFNEKQMSGLYNRVADLYIATGQYHVALPFAQRSEQITLSNGFQKGSASWLFSQFRSNIALAGQDEWPKALAQLDMIDDQVKLAKTPPAMANKASLRAYIYLKNGRTNEALNVLQNSLNWNVDNFGENNYQTAGIRGLYAVALWQKNLPLQARAEFERTMQSITSPDSLTGDFVENAFQRKTKRFILQSYMELLAINAPTQPKDAELLFQVADQLNTSTVQQALSDAAVRAGVTVPGLSDIIRLEQDAKNEIATLTSYIAGQGGEDDKRRNPLVVDQMRARMRKLELERNGYKTQISKSYPEYFQLIQPKSPSTGEIAQQLKPDELFVTILPMEDKTYLWAIDSKGTVNFKIAEMGEQKLREVVEKIRKTLDVAHLGARAPMFDYAAAYQLYQQFLSPFDAALKDKKHLIVATSGVLAKLPLAVLTRSPYGGSDAAQAPWLVKEIAVSHVPTANGWLSLKRLGKTPSGPQALIAWGDPAFDYKQSAQVALLAPNAQASTVRSAATIRSADLVPRNVLDPDTYVTYSKLPALPETRDEVLELAKILAANPEQDVILGASATRASVLKSSDSGQLARKQVVVFATHGLLAGDLPNLNQPALAMASTANPADSPLLTLEDVLSLKLNADWVVLSACNTAGADGRAEEALTGLARGFFFAGSRSLLVTHWAVESESAMMLTTKTFAAYKGNSDLRRAEALRTGMLATMALPRFAHPAFWAPYALVGEGGR